MKFKIHIFILLLLIVSGCCSTSKITRKEKKIIQKIEHLVPDEIGIEKNITFSETGDYILLKMMEERMESIVIHVLVFDENLHQLYESKNEFRNAYWNGNFLRLEKTIGILKPGENIHQTGSENKIVYQFDPSTKMLQRVGADL